jgi:hypothetical protein
LPLCRFIDPLIERCDLLDPGLSLRMFQRQDFLK